MNKTQNFLENFEKIVNFSLFFKFFENISGFRSGTAPGTPRAATPLQAILGGPRFLRFFVKIFDNANLQVFQENLYKFRNKICY